MSNALALTYGMTLLRRGASWDQVQMALACFAIVEDMWRRKPVQWVQVGSAWPDVQIRGYRAEGVVTGMNETSEEF